MIPPRRFDIFPPDWGMLRRSIDAFKGQKQGQDASDSALVLHKYIARGGSRIILMRCH